MKKRIGKMDDELRPEYDLTILKGGVRGKYAQRARRPNRADFIKFLDASPDVPPQSGDECPE
jgi:hypothetical protein